MALTAIARKIILFCQPSVSDYDYNKNGREESVLKSWWECCGERQQLKTHSLDLDMIWKESGKILFL
jgi:hypothetical protein